MTRLEEIVRDGLEAMDDAVARVIWKYDHTPYCNGVNDDSEIVQRLLDKRMNVRVPGSCVIRKALDMSRGGVIFADAGPGRQLPYKRI